MANSVDQTPRERILALLRAESRIQILNTLADTESVTRRQLRSQATASRTTVSRALNSVVEMGWVEKPDDAYQLTRSGQEIQAAVDQMLDRVRTVQECAEFLRLFPPDVPAPDFLAADDFTVTYSTKTDPEAPAREQTKLLENAESIRILLPAINIEPTQIAYERILRGDLDVNAIMSPRVGSIVNTEPFASLVTEMMESGGLSIQLARDQILIYICLSNAGTAQIGLVDSPESLQALLETTDTQIYEWAADSFTEVRDHSVLVDI